MPFWGGFYYFLLYQLLMPAFLRSVLFLCASFFPLFLPSNGQKPNKIEQFGTHCTNYYDGETWKDNYGCNEFSEKLRIFVVADAGGKVDENENHSPTEGQQSVANLMAELAEKEGLNLVLNLGDNFYENGVTKDTVNELFKTNFLNIFGNVGTKDVPWYTVAGNRDYHHLDGYDPIAPQIEMIGGKWTFPAPYYIVHYNFGINLEKSVRFVMVDTVILCGKNRKIFKDEKTFTEKIKHKSEKHFEWLKNELELANKKGVDFLFVAGHYPLYVTDGDRSFTCAKRFNELLSVHKVRAYLSGHEHNLKHLVTKVKKFDVQMFVAGAGSRMESANEEKHVPKGYKHLLKFAYPDSVKKPEEYLGGGFIAMEMCANERKAKVNFYAAGHIHPTKQKFVEGSKFKYNVEL